eukprot:gb/GEZN01013915.1/.p1 GENE.gb/GEZN01013915.1/~~gb/GEZN01013915.1/.p1  ORF type:complete len:301 (+),score=32.01 gb/GEZN01013915.1/:32-934(+)
MIRTTTRRPPFLFVAKLFPATSVPFRRFSTFGTVVRKATADTSPDILEEIPVKKISIGRRGLTPNPTDASSRWPFIQAFACGEEGAPAVILIQEWWGVTDQVKRQAASIAKAGNFRCVIPDLYRGKIGVTKEEANHHMTNLDFPGAVSEIGQTAEFLLEKERSPKVGVIGFCMGGALTWLSAQQHADKLTCAIPCYGIPSPDWEHKLTIPVQAHFGMLDNLEGFSDPKTAKALEKKLKANGSNAEFFFYDKAGHGFLNSIPAPFSSWEERTKQMGFPPNDPVASDQAWDRIFAFLTKHLS